MKKNGITEQIDRNADRLATMKKAAGYPEGFLYRSTRHPGLGGYVSSAATRTATREK
jgi:hypothetical protein